LFNQSLPAQTMQKPPLTVRWHGLPAIVGRSIVALLHATRLYSGLAGFLQHCPQSFWVGLNPIDPHYWSELPGTRPEAPPEPLPTGGDRAAEEEGDEPSYVISIAARMVGMHAQTLRYYERAGLVTPARTKGNIRLYRRSDIERLRLIQKLIADHGVNLAGVDLVLRMEVRIRTLRARVAVLEGRLSRQPEAGDEP